MIETQNIKLPKIIVLVFFSMLMIAFGSTSVRANVPPTVDVTVEGKPLVMPVAPIIVEDRTLVGVRSVGEAVGGTLEWDPVKRQVTVTRQSDVVILTVGKNTALVNGKAVELPVAPQIVNDRAMVPLRFIAEALGGTVEWNADTRTVNILRKPTAISAMAYTNSGGKARVVLTLSESLLRVTPKVTDTNLTLDLYPATLTLNQPDRRVYDLLTQELHLQADGRTVQFRAQLWYQPNFRYALSPDGTQLTVEFDQSVTGYQVKQDNRITTVDIAATGKVDFTAFPLDNPPRLVVDLPGVHMAPDVQDAVPANNPYVTRVRAADRGADGTRVVLDLKANVPAQTVATDKGVQVQFAPLIQAVKTENLAGKTRIIFAGSLPMDAKVTAQPDQHRILIEVPQGRSGLAGNVVKPADGSIDSITVAPGATPNSSLITIALPYYVGHTVVSNPGDPNIVLDLVTSPVYGKRIWIDAGHGQIPGGNDDPGSIGRTYGTREKVVNLQVALELQQRLQAAGAIVYMTRTGDAGVDFTDRPALVNAVKPAIDLFVSIHHNSSAALTVRGIETYYWTTNPKSKAAADMIHAAVVQGLGFPDRKVRSMDFYVIKATKAPAVLVELGFLSNADEEKAIAEPGVASKTYPAKAAEGIKTGIFNYFWQENRSAVAN